VQLLSLRAKGTPEQVAAFPKPLFLFQFVRAWNKTQNEPNFVDKQVDELDRFDSAKRSGSPPLPVPHPLPATTRTTPVPPEPTTPKKPSVPAKAPAPRPTKRATPPPQAGPSHHVRVIRHGSTSPPPTRGPRYAPIRTHRPNPPLDRDDSVARRRQVEVVMTAHPKKFREVEASGDEFEPSPSPSPSPPPPTQPKRPESAPDVRSKLVYKKACERCQKGNRDCVVDKMVGGVCVGCKVRRYGCDHTGMTGAKTMWVSRPATDTDSDSEVEVVEDTKGKKRRAESPVAPKKERPVKVKVEKVERPKATTKAKATAKATTKATTKGKGRQSGASKGPAIMLDSPADDADLMVIDEVSEEGPKPKRARLAPSKSESVASTLQLIYFQISKPSTTSASLCSRNG
jgi:hypothetical protein